MEADWEVEIGGGAPVIEAHWAGFVDLRTQPERVDEIREAVDFPPLADLLLALNSARSHLWTSKCDVWEPGRGALACYIDLLPHAEVVFADAQTAERMCRDLAARLASPALVADDAQSSRYPILSADAAAEAQASILLVIRTAVTEQAEGFGVTAYLSTDPSGSSDTEAALAAAMVAFSSAVLALASQESPKQS